MSRCSNCRENLPFGAWWCPECGQATVFAPEGALRDRGSGPDTSRQAAPDTSPEAEPEAAAGSADDPSPGYVERQQGHVTPGARRQWPQRRVLVGGGIAVVVAGLAALMLVVLPGKSSVVHVGLAFTTNPFASNVFSSPLAEVAIGSNPPVPMIVDTGSVGVRVFADAIGTTRTDGVGTTVDDDAVRFADGSLWSGQVGTATVGLGGVVTTRRVPIELVDTVTCQSQATCPYPGGVPTIENAGIDGILGIGLSGPVPGDPTTNPLLELPGRDGRVWTLDIAAGQWTLNAPPLAAPVTRIQLTSLGTTDGETNWDDAPTLCWTIGSDRRCEPTVFDSGAALMFVGSQGLHVRTTPLLGDGPPIVVGNVVVSVSLPDRSAPFWSFKSGDDPGASAVAVLPGQQPVINTGVQAFFSLEIQYNATDGTITIANPQD